MNWFVGIMNSKGFRTDVYDGNTEIRIHSREQSINHVTRLKFSWNKSYISWEILKWKFYELSHSEIHMGVTASIRIDTKNLNIKVYFDDGTQTSIITIQIPPEA